MSFIIQPSAAGGLTKVTRTSNTVLTGGNSGNWISITSGTFTQTFDPCANLGSTWFVYLENAGTGDITLDPSGSETIDGLTSYIMYPGEVRLIQSDGVSLTSIVISSFFRTFTSSGTFTKPPGYTAFGIDIIGAGGGGARGSAGGVGPSGGSGGGRYKDIFSSAAFAASETVTIGAGGAGATTDSTNGTPGGTSSIGSILAATGGGEGQFNTWSLASGAAIVAHTIGVSGASGVGFAGALGTSSGQSAEFGGGQGGIHTSTINEVGKTAGSSLFAAGGGGGGSASSDSIARAGGRGGASFTYFPGGGGSSASGAAGGNGANGNFLSCGQGGGGGGTNNTNNGFAGGDGGTPGGGGGGGGRGATSRGNGGSGARGEARIWGIV